MSSNVTSRDGVFTVRQAAWWDLDGSHVLPEHPTRQEAQAIAHPWEPESEPVYRQVATSTHSVDEFSDPPVPVYEELEGFKLNVRSDDGYPLGVVSDTFANVNNSEMYDIAEAIEGTVQHGNPVKYETGGSLKGGRKVWLLLRLTEPLVVPGDPNGKTIPYFAMQNSHDGSGAFRGQSIMTRIVCDNTATMADLEAKKSGTEFVFRHTKNVDERISQARQALAGWRNSVESFQKLTEELLDIPVSKASREWWLEQFIPMPAEHSVSGRVVTNVETARELIRSILAGPTCEGIGFTSYGLVQASVEYLNHARRANSAESRFKRSYLDRNVIVSDAMTLARQAVSM